MGGRKGPKLSWAKTQGILMWLLWIHLFKKPGGQPGQPLVQWHQGRLEGRKWTPPKRRLLGTKVGGRGRTDVETPNRSRGRNPLLLPKELKSSGLGDFRFLAPD